MCAAGEERVEPYWASYRRDDIAFMCLKVDEEEMSKPPPNSAIVYIEGASLSSGGPCRIQITCGRRLGLAG